MKTKTRTLLLARATCMLMVTVALTGGTAMAAREEAPPNRRELVQLLARSSEALRELGHPELSERVRGVAAEVERAEMGERGALSERETVEGRMELFRKAFEVVRMAGHRDVAERIEPALHGYELAIADRRDDEARDVRRRAPEWREEVELIGFAAHVCALRGSHETAEMFLQERDRLWPGWRARGARERAAESDHDEPARGANRERALAEERLEMMHLALPALRESERDDLVEVLERAIRALEVNLEGREDREAREVRAASPGLGDQIEILRLAARAWNEFGHETKAQRLEAYADEMHAAWRQRQDRRKEREAHESERSPAPSLEREVADLRERLQRIEDMLAELRSQRRR